MAKRGLSVAWAMAAVFLLAVLLRVLIVPAGRFYEWRRLDQEIRVLLGALRPIQQGGTLPAGWDCAEQWVGTAYSNVCFSPGHVTTAEMYRLRDDLKARLGGPADLETLRWIWSRLGETGPHGREYIERFGPEFRACFPPAPGVESGAGREGTNQSGGSE